MKKREEKMFRQLTVKCKIEKKKSVSYVSEMRNSHTKHTVLDLPQTQKQTPVSIIQSRYSTSQSPMT